jgi:hypothetical protein
MSWRTLPGETGRGSQKPRDATTFWMLCRAWECRLPIVGSRRSRSNTSVVRSSNRAVTAGLLDHEDQADSDDRADPATNGRYLYLLDRRSDRDLDTLTDRILRSIAARERARQALRIARDGPGGPATRSTAPPTAIAA